MSKSSTKRANGVYYTPRPIVDYIVRSTLGPELAGKSPMQLAGCTSTWTQDPTLHPLTVLDPACGVGYFLHGAYDLLLAWCLDWYCANDPSRWPGQVEPTTDAMNNAVFGSNGAFRLTTQERRRILRDHLYGVDIDAAAVLQTREALAGKADSRDHLAVDATTQIRCGNSLVDADFDWRKQFPEVTNAGGFDVVIGNPPYVNSRILEQQGAAVKRYYREHFRCAYQAFDLYVLFVERAYNLLRAGGRCGMIVPNKLATLDYARPCRELLLTETTMDAITDVSSQQVFREANVFPYIMTFTKSPPAPGHRTKIITAGDSIDTNQTTTARSVEQNSWSAESGISIHETLDVESRVPTMALGKRSSIHSGTTGFNAKQVAEALQERRDCDREAFEFIVSRNIDRYRISLGDLRFIKRQFARPLLPKHAAVVTRQKRELYSKPKIVVAGMSRRIEAALDTDGVALGVQVYAICDLQDDPRFILGLLNSKLMSYLFQTRFQAKRLSGGYLAINKSQLAMLPIPMIDEADASAINTRRRIIDLVGQLPRMNESVDQGIDAAVYELYRLTNDEITTVGELVIEN